MITFPGIRLGAFKDSEVRAEVKKIVDTLRQVSGALSKSLQPGQSPAANPVGGSTITGGPTGLPVPVNGDMLVGSGSVWSKLGMGSSGQVLTAGSSSPSWSGLPASAIIVQENDVTVDASTTTLDFGNGLDVTSSPSGEANVVVDLSEYSGGALPVSGGGTGATTAGNARTNLGLGALATLSSVDASTIDNRTRSIWIPNSDFFDNGASMMASATSVLPGDSTTFPTQYYIIELPDASALPELVTMFKVPSDYASGATWKFYVAAGATGPSKNIVIDLYFKTVSAGSAGGMAASNDVTSTGNVLAVAGTEHTLNILSIASSTGIVANGLVRMQFRRNGSHASDDYTDTVFFLGLVFEYTADS